MMKSPSKRELWHIRKLKKPVKGLFYLLNKNEGNNCINYLDLCFSANHELHHVTFEQLDFGETSYLELFYNADVSIVDMTLQVLP